MGSKSSKLRGDFPFLNDNDTIQTIKEAHTLFILRGLPGSGKSTISKLIEEKYRSISAVAFADGLGISPLVEEPKTDDNRYAQLDEQIQQGFKDSKNVIVVDDNHHSEKRLDDLLNLAKGNDYIVILVTPKTEWSNDCEKLAIKSQWKLSVEKLNKMKEGFQQHIIPDYFGWFLVRKSAEEMRKNAEEFLNLLSKNEEFTKEFVKNVQWHLEEDFNLQEYFQNRPTLLHCTTKFCDYGAVPHCESYAHSKAVEESYSKAFILKVTALFVTPRTVGARVSLDRHQKQLWPKEEVGDDGDDSGIKAGLPVGSRAHITLACAPGVKAVQTGLDLLDILKFEKAGNKPEYKVETEKGLLSLYSEGRCMINLSGPINVKTLFSGFYPKMMQPTTES
ncbi:2',3'-cyclic-nucleotide 3'-phosphodiesterase isoform X1 [Heterodontus francisci]